MLRIHAACENISPLLMNPATDELLEKLRNRTPSPKRTDWSPEDEAAQKLYRNEDGRVGIPALNLFSCLANAGRKVKSGRSQISTATSTTLYSFLDIEEEFFPFIGDPEWVVDMRRGRNPNGGEMVCLVRPKFTEWTFEFTLVIDETQIGEDTVKALVQVAGRQIGLCDFRPACKGPFGRFAIAKWERLSGDAVDNGKVSISTRKLAKSAA